MSKVSRKQFIQDRRKAGVWVHKPFCIHKVVRLVKRHPGVRRKNKRYADRPGAADTGPTIDQNLCPFSINRLQPFDRLGYQMALDGVVCTVSHCDLAVDDRCRLMLVVMGFGGWWCRVDHVQIVSNVQDVCETKLGGVRCSDEIAEVDAAKDAIIVWTLLRRQEQL